MANSNSFLTLGNSHDSPRMQIIMDILVFFFFFFFFFFFHFYPENVYCVDEGILMSTLNIPLLNGRSKNTSLNYRHLLPGLAP